MEKPSILFILLFFLANANATSPTARSVDKRPQAVRAWFKNLPHAKQKLAHLHFYFHDTVTGPNATAFTVAQANITGPNPTNFGVTRMMDNPLTLGPELDSGTIGRARGLYGAASFETVDLLMVLNYVFTDGEFNGSTLSVLAHNPIFDRYREMPVLGGTGNFRLARGIATAQTALISGQDAVVEYNVVVLYYDSK